MSPAGYGAARGRLTTSTGALSLIDINEAIKPTSGPAIG